MSLALIRPGQVAAQTLPTAAAAPSTAPAPGDFNGSVPAGKVSPVPLELSLDDAIERGLKNNLGIILSGTQTAEARAQRLSELQSLLPSVDFKATEAEMQTDLPAQGLRIPGIPTIIGPFGYADLRASLTWSLVDLGSLHNYLAAKHNFSAARLSAEDAQNLVILTVGNAYLLVLADQAQVASVQAQVATSRISLNQAVANHSAGTAPRLDMLRAQVDYQSIEQRLIVAQDALAKDKLGLARAIGLPLEQAFNLTDQVPYAPFDDFNVQTLIQQADRNREDLAAMVEQTAAAEEQRKAAKMARYPTLTFNGDYGDIGVNVKHSHGTGDASGQLSVPLFKEFGLRGQAQEAQAQLDTQRDRLSDMKAQVDADVRDALLDIASAQQQVEVARSSRDLASQALSDAQERYKSGVSDNLAVSEAQQSVAQADEQYVSSLYRDNVAKLSLARALGEAENYKTYLGGK
jgi:outer membrane protein TolC